MVVRLSLMALVMFLLAGTLAAGERIQAFTSGPWSGSIFKIGEPKKFSMCNITGVYESGTNLILSITRNYQFLLALHHNDWNFGQDTSGNIAIHVDGAHLGTFKLLRLSDTMIGAIFSNSDWMLQRLSKGRRMSVIALNKKHNFKLTGSAKALARTRSCVNQQLAMETGSTNPVAKRQKSQAGQNRLDRPRSANRRVARNYQKRPPYPKPLGLGPAGWDIFTMVAVGEIAQMVPVEPSLRRLGIDKSWSSNGITGYAGRWKPSGSISSMTSSIVGAMGGSCDEYSTKMNQSERAGDSEVMTAFAQCRTGRIVQAVVVTAARSPKVFSIFIHIGQDTKRDALRAINARVVGFARVMSKENTQR